MTLETYENGVNILITAYRNSTLFHGKCEACAVGNLLGGQSEWRFVIGTTNLNKGSSSVQQLGKYYLDKGKDLIDKSPYTVDEITAIERAFEMAIFNMFDNIPERRHFVIYHPKKAQYMGLCAVLDVMAEMIEDKPTTDTSQSKEELEMILSNYLVNSNV